MTDIELPTRSKPSKLDKPQPDEDVIRAGARFAAFREKYPDGFVDSILERVIEHPDGNLTFLFQGVAYIGAARSVPDATAWAQGSTKSDNAIIAASPAESADTIARSRALRNLGILASAEEPKAEK